MRDYLATHERRRRLAPRAILVGILAGLTAVAFRKALHVADGLRDSLFDYAHHAGIWGIVIPIATCSLLAGASVFLVRRFAPEAAGSGIPFVESVLHRQWGMRWERILPVKFVGGFLAMSSGMALGREGPTVQMGAAVGQMVDGWFHTTARERRSLVAAGAAAGLAGAFNAPLAGLVFVLEELQRDFSTGIFTAAFLSSVTADLVTRALTGQSPIFRVAMAETPSLHALPAFIALGVACGLLGLLHNRLLLKGLDWFDRFRSAPMGSTGMGVGMAIAVIGWFSPLMLGDGHRLVEEALAGAWSLGAIAGIIAIRLAMTVASYCSGAPGGIFAPLLVLGSQAGRATGLITQTFFPGIHCNLATFAVVGMAACFSAVVRAPLTGIILVTELTGNFQLMLSLLAASLVSYGLVEFLRDAPIYEALAQRDLRRKRETPRLEETLVLEMPVYHASAFDGRAVADLGLPPGCILVTVRRNGEEQIPDGSYVLKAGDWLTAVVAPQAAHAAALLREGSTR